ncbi:F-box/LRR-repeat protein 5-like [Babylonia areolata]|uniref:F-box/LRR-repeat protein 5-like n=1 Tax=Babylonia areolata TaxID=304850 RepID=UPI003FCF918D
MRESKMAPKCPEEVDVFTVPHSRMKQLVHKYLDLVSSTNFRDAGHMTRVLEKLCHTFNVFKAHEQIENRFIMCRLKEKLTALHITDAAVCNCHSDNRLTEMLSLVLDGYRWAQRGERERVKYGLRLRSALEDFTQVFIPHMKEEEEVFQPMLVEYFTYDELKELKAKVIQQHLQEEEEAPGTEKCVPECDSDKEEEEEEGESSPLERLPTELTMKILSHLSPRDLCRCAQVSQQLNRAAMDPSLWRTVLPVQWAAGNWDFQPEEDNEEERVGGCGGEEEEEDYSYLHDEDADKDESSDSDSSESQDYGTLDRALREVRVVSGLVRHLLPRVGAGVERVVLGGSRGISSSLVHKILKLCPNLKDLHLAHTRITDAAFKEYGLKGGSCRLERLDLSGCENITDSTLHSLAGNHHTPSNHTHLPPLSSTTHLPCRGKGKGHSTPTTTLVALSVNNDEENVDGSGGGSLPVIEEADASYTDVPVELCHLDCGDLRGCSVPDLAQSMLLEVVGGPGLVPCCSVNRGTCCSRQEGGPAGNRDWCCGSEGRRGGGGDHRQEGRKEVEEEEKGGKEEKEEEEPHALHGLTYLSLNGCYGITDLGLRSLSERGGLPQLQYLDLSGCLNLSGEGVASLVDTCQSLDHAFLFYCDNVFPDPFPTTASGCRNLECNTAFCCRSGD